MPKNWQLLLIFVVGILLLFGANPTCHLLLAWGVPKDITDNLAYGLEHLGVVVVVAMLLRATLEASAQREFLSVVNKEVKDQIKASTKILTYRISTLFDDTLQKELERSVLNPTFIRPQYTLRLKLKPMASPPEPGLLEVLLETSYQVQNVAVDRADPEDYSIEFWIDDVNRSASDRCRFTRIAYGLQDPPPAYDREELERSGAITRKNGVLSLKAYAGSIKPAASLYVDIHAVQVMRTQDHFVWNLVGLTQKLSVIVELSGGLTFDNFNVFPRPMHHLEDLAFAKPEKPPNSNTLTLEINQVLLPFQGVEIRWFPVPVAPPTPASPVGSTA